METQSTISAFQQVMESHVFTDVSSTFSEGFAVKRYLKKFQKPDPALQKTLSQQCWDEWISFDAGLPKVGLYSREWYLVRDLLHKQLRAPKVCGGEFRFPKGSEFHSTRGRNSIEARLSRSLWTCTYENFESFARIVYGHNGLKKAFRRRYLHWFRRKNFDISVRQADRLLYKGFVAQGGSKASVAFSIFSWKLEQITTFTQGSRFSSVPKNNAVRRPINVEPFGNTLSQSLVGEHIRSEILRIFHQDLDSLQVVHRLRISNLKDATIDLKNASDGISLSLVEFLLPPPILRWILSTRSPFVLGPDGSYHQVRKVSSMGNGFTFELMTMIFTALCRVLDANSSVFGDDIIIAVDKSERLVELLTEVGLVVNKEKSFTDGPFRESCGANFHSDEGYVESYDFMYPESIGDCVTTWNKVVRLSQIYPQFSVLKNRLYRILPKALHGGPSPDFTDLTIQKIIGMDRDQRALSFPLFFCTPRVPKGLHKVSPKLLKALQGYQVDINHSVMIPGFEFKSEEASPCRHHLRANHHWAKYLMYLSAGRRSKDVVTGKGEWKKVWFILAGGRHFRASSVT